jgi:hypothetical protein
MANSGFTSLQYLNSDVVFDSACNTNRMYMLNTDYLRLEVAASRDFVPGEAKMSVNQDAYGDTNVLVRKSDLFKPCAPRRDPHIGKGKLL